jgi:hypothetical protein
MAKLHNENPAGLFFFLFLFSYIKNFAWFSKNKNVSQNHTRKKRRKFQFFPNFVGKKKLTKFVGQKNHRGCGR